MFLSDSDCENHMGDVCFLLQRTAELQMENKPAVMGVTEANRSFSKAEALVSESGSVVLTKRKKPKYLLVDLEKTTVIEMSEDEKIDFVAGRILAKHRHAFEELARK